VDLDNNNVQLPQVPLIDFPEMERTELVNHLNEVVHADIVGIDTLEIVDSAPLAQPHLDEKIHIIFLRFFTSLLHSYSQHMINMRFVPTPMSMFDMKGFMLSIPSSSKVSSIIHILKSLLELRPFFFSPLQSFYKLLMETQLFACFLERQSKSRESIIDEWIDEGIYKQSPQQILDSVLKEKEQEDIKVFKMEETKKTDLHKSGSRVQQIHSQILNFDSLMTPKLKDIFGDLKRAQQSTTNVYITAFNHDMTGL